MLVKLVKNYIVRILSGVTGTTAHYGCNVLLIPATPLQINYHETGVIPPNLKH